MIKDVEEFIALAKKHGEDSEPDHEVGDLQDLLRAAWWLMNDTQRRSLMGSDPALSLEEIMEEE